MKVKYILLQIIAIMLFAAPTFSQDPVLYMRYNVDIYPTPASQITMYIQVWQPGLPNTILDAWSGTIVPHHSGETESYTCTGYGSSYDIYSVEIWDNSGGTNHAFVGGSYSTTDDFGYKPYSTLITYSAYFSDLTAHTASVSLF